MAPSPQHSGRNVSHKSLIFAAADPRFTFHVSRFTVPLISILLALLSLVGTACGTTAPTGKIIFDDPRGTVSLQTISDQSIQASHPINLEPALLTQLLTGIELHDEGAGRYHVKGIQSMITGKADTYPLFSEDQVQFLAPLIAEGLRTATANQSVEFRVVTTQEGSNRFQSPTTETTTGSLYAYGRQLYVILNQYRYNPMRTSLEMADSIHHSMEPLDYSGLKFRTLRFTPKAALRADSLDPPAGGKPTDRFLAVDYQMLQHAPAATTVQTTPIRESPAGTSASEAPSHTTEALAQEVETLRKELQSVQKQLGSQPTTQNNPKRKTTPQQK
jgi:hypothetical protein